ncbi:hypothetical protein ACFQ05_18600 [Amycolatopsis umgeniensis]|uniref:Uncharacterized protein n=1 Tax=Amycolatopsis umgeniensis TaxID=336628 RepID=A0A841BF49_9PSEU|nr:hypothetical protein [Amycolatopsis umgeniensis]MBB5857620.1 hypothetical protein [Amycolatopsis umgeniensis]
MRSRHAARRIKHGDGHALPRFRWWQQGGRALFYLRPAGDEGEYAVDVRHGRTDSSGHTNADLYLDGRHHARSRLPAAFPVPGGTIEVKKSVFGLKRCHFVTVDGVEHQLQPDRFSAEGRREHLDRTHPALSRGIGFFSTILLLVSVAVLITQLLEKLTRPAPIAEHIGTFTSPVALPVWLNIAIGIAAALASTERALRLRYNWLLDGGAG